MFQLPQLFAVGFANLAMLGWLAAAAAPLLIHLWSRHRFREAPWAAMQFLLAAMRKNARRLQLQQWLLLAVRTLIIMLVVLAAAEPYAEQLLTGGGRKPTHKVLVIDGSYSMAYRDNGASRFSRGKQLAVDLVRDSNPADTFTVILMATPATTILGREVVDHAAVAAEIESLAQSHTAADLASALTRVQEALSLEKNQRAHAERHEVFFFTDLQRSTWATVPGSHAPRGNPLPSRSGGESQANSTRSVGELRSHAERGNEYPRRIAELAKQASLVIVDIGSSRVSNLAITSFTAGEPLITLNQEIIFEATLHQFGNQPRPQCVVELIVNDVPVGEQTVDVPAGGEATVRFTHRFQSTGRHTVLVRTSADGLTIDDARWLVVPVREELRVLCVAGREGAARYVAHALNPDPSGSSPIRPVIVSEGDLAELDLAEFDCVFFCNVAQFTPGEAERLRRYALDGGGIVFFLGNRVIAESYNALAAGKRPLLPVRLEEIVNQPQFGLDPLNYRHPIVAPFRGRERAGLLTTPVARYYRLELSDGPPNVEVAAAMRNGDPFIVAAPLGRGRTLLVATAGSLESVDAATGEPWTIWPTSPSFLPVVRELLSYAIAGRQTQLQQPVGEMLGGTLPSSPFAESERSTLHIERPDGRAEPVSIETTPAGALWSYGPTDRSGIYILRGLPDRELQHFAVNVDTVESDLEKADPEQLPSELLLHSTPQRAGSDGGMQITRAGWEHSLLWLALVMLLVESILAWQYGRGAV